MKNLNLISKNIIKNDRKKLLSWYLKNKRTLPWRSSQDPYLIWISEVMLQQTTVTAVIPFYEKFIKQFPDVTTLSNSNIENIYEYWAGLGYYSRARNLHKAAQIIFSKYNGIFPQTYQELIKLPGFGPYTSRAVASLAYNQPVGVLDGNVIRILSRQYGLDIKWWENTEKNKLQILSDQLAGTKESASLNQAMMELGATVCTPKKVMCLMCPWNKTCLSYKTDSISKRPLQKPKADFEIWSWNFKTQVKSKKILLKENTETPFLKNNWLPESQALKLAKKPKVYDFKHSVTKYEIFVTITPQSKIDSKTSPRSSQRSKESKWVSLDKVAQVNPTSLLKKIIKNIQ